jgi:hypothetical protein
MTQEKVLLVRAAFGAVGALAAVVALRWPMPKRIASASERDFRRAYWLAFAASRILLFALVFLVARIPSRGDLTTLYYPEAHRAMDGRIPDLTFYTSYAPLNGYMNAAALKIRDTPLSLIALAILAEILAVPAWLGAFKEMLDKETIRRGALLYFVQPLALWTTIVDGQNNAIIAAWLALSLYFLSRRRDIGSGVAYSMPLVTVKFLALMFLPCFVVGVKRWARWLIAALMVPAAVYGYFALYLRADIFKPLSYERTLQTSGGLPFVIDALRGKDVMPFVDIATAVILLAVFVWQYRYRLAQAGREAWPVAVGCVMTVMVLLTVSKKAWTVYAVMVMFPLCLLVAKHARRRWLWLVWPVLCFIEVFEPSYWATHLEAAYPARLHGLIVGGNHGAWLLLVMDIALIGCNVYCIWLAMREMKSVSARNVRTMAAS